MHRCYKCASPTGFFVVFQWMFLQMCHPDGILSLAEGTIVTLDQRDRFEKDGKTIHLVPFWEFAR